MSVRDHLLLDGAGIGAGTNLFDYPGGVSTVLCDGNFAGATVTLQWRGRDGAWSDVPNVSFTEAGMMNISFGAGIVFRGNVAGGTSPAVNLYLTGTF